MADFGSGFVSGFMQAQQAKLARAQQADQHQAMMLQMQEARIKLNAMKQEEAWQAGRADAAKNGGLNGVIDYMEKTRPEEGLKLKVAAQEYQNSILDSDYKKAMTEGVHDENVIKTMTAAGNMYGQLNEVYAKDPELAKQAYQKNFDLIKQLDPKAPPEFDPNRAMMAVGLAVPQAARFQALQDSLKAKSTEGQHVQDLMMFKATGNKIGEETILKSMEDDKTKQLVAERKAQKLELQIGNMNQDQAQQLRTEYTKNVNAQTLMGQAVTKMESLASSDDIYTNPQKQVAMINQYARFNSPGIVTDFDSRDAQRSGFLAGLWQMKQKAESGSPLTPDAIDGIASAMRTQWKAQQPFIKDQDEYYGQLADKYGIARDEVINPLFRSTNQLVSHGELIGSIKKIVPEFKESAFIEENVKANPELADYLKEHPEYRQTMLQKFYDQVAPKQEK